MRTVPYAVLLSLATAVSGWTAASVTVNKTPGAGDFTSIQAAIDSGATTITVTDSQQYLENLEIGSPDTGGTAVTLTSNQSGDKRPVITPSADKSYTTARRTGQGAGFGLFANHSVVSNLIIEAQPDLGANGMGAMVIAANNVRLENCLFRIAAGTTATLRATQSPLLFFGQQGDGGGNPTPGGQDSNGCVVRNCEFIGLAPDADPVEPTGTGTDESGTPDGSAGYLKSKPDGTGQGSGYIRVDVYTVGSDITITLEGCYFHHCLDYGIFPTNLGSGAGALNIVVRKCRFDANGKFFFRGRGANVDVESSVFTRTCQGPHGDTENAAIALNTQDGHSPTGAVRNCVFVNCGSANAKKAYYGGVNNHNAERIAVDRCTFVDCLTGVGAGTGNTGLLTVSKSIFHQIGDNIPPSVDVDGITLTPDNTNLVDGLYRACTNGLFKGELPGFDAADKWSGVFNAFKDGDAQITIDTCLVGSVELEDSRSWDEALAANEVTGARLYCGFDTHFAGTETVTRGTPVFVSTDPNAPNAFQLAATSPGQGLGADLAPVLAPRLNLSRAGNQVTISWSQSLWMTSYVLKSASSLNAPTWVTVPGVTGNGVDHAVTVPIGSASQFFAVAKE